MKTVSIDELKRRLSWFIDQAASGERVIVTRHRKPVASITAAGTEHVRIGSRFGRARLKPVLQGPTKGQYLTALFEDRRPGEDTR